MRWLLFSLLLLSGTATADFETEIPDNGRTAPEGGDNIENSGDLANINSNNGDTTINQGAGSGRPMPANTAIAPSLMGMNQQSCLRSVTGGLQVLSLGVSGGSWVEDEACSRRLDAITLNQLGLRLGAVATMCTSPVVFKAMLSAGSTCPISKGGRLLYGKAALQVIKKQPRVYIADYDEHIQFYQNIFEGSDTNDQENVSGSLSDRYRTTKQRRTDRRSDIDEPVDTQ